MTRKSNSQQSKKSANKKPRRGYTTEEIGNIHTQYDKMRSAMGESWKKFHTQDEGVKKAQEKSWEGFDRTWGKKRDRKKVK